MIQKNLLIIIDSKKCTCMDKIPPKLIKLSAKVLSKPSATVVNNSFKKRYFQVMLKGCLCYKTIFCHKVALDAQLMNFFI